MTNYRDIHRRVKRLTIDPKELGVVMAHDLFLRALEKAARRPHKATRQQDEWFCHSCGSRWDLNEPAPETDCEPLAVRHSPVLKGDDLHCTICKAVWPLGTPEPATECVE